MDNTLWLQNGKLIVDSSGSPILCSTCPCTPVLPPTKYYFYKQLIIAGCEGLQYRSSVVKFDPSTDTYSLGWNSKTTYMSPGACSGWLEFRDYDLSLENRYIDNANIGGLFSLCLGDLLLYYMGRPTKWFQHTSSLDYAQGIWAMLYQDLEYSLYYSYSEYSESTDDSGDGGSTGEVHTEILAMFPLYNITALFSHAALRLKEKALLLAENTDNIQLELDKLALDIYALCYAPLYSDELGNVHLGDAYDTYTFVCDRLAAFRRSKIDDWYPLPSSPGIWEKSVIARFLLLTYDTTLLIYAIWNDSAIALAKNIISVYEPPGYSDVIDYHKGAGIGRYTSGRDAIVAAIQNCRDNAALEQKLEAALLALLTTLDEYLTPDAGDMAQRAALLAKAYRTAKVAASATLCTNMLTNRNTGTSMLRLGLWQLYQTLVLKFVNTALRIRPISYTWAVLKTTELLLPELLPLKKDDYALPLSLLNCNTTYSYKKYLWHCTKGMVLNKVYTAVPDLKFFNKDTAYLLLWQLQQMAATPAALFRALSGQLFTVVKSPENNIDSFAYMLSRWASWDALKSIGLSTLVSIAWLGDAYIDNLAEKGLRSYYLLGASNGKGPIAELPLVEGTQLLQYDFTSVATPIYVLCRSAKLPDFSTTISPMGYADTWTYTITGITGVVKEKALPDWEKPTKTQALLALLTDLSSLPTDITVFINDVLVRTGYHDTSDTRYWRNTGLYADLEITKEIYDNALEHKLLKGYKVVTQTALATVVIRALGLDRCSSFLWSPQLTYHQFTPTWISSAVDPYLELTQNPYLNYDVVHSLGTEFVDQLYNPIVIKPMPSMTVTADLLSLLPTLLQ